MQEGLRTIDAPGEPSYYQRKPLPPIQTKIIQNDLSQIQRIAPVGTALYKTPSDLIVEPRLIRRQSRTILGLFSRNKGSKDGEDGDSGRIHSYNHGKPFQDGSARLGYLSKGRSIQDEAADPNPTAFWTALSRAAKHITLAVPSMDADSLLKARKQHPEIIAQETSNLDAKTKSAEQALEWKASIFVLTKDAQLLQYSAIGLPDRLPERTIRLTTESAAFASDAIPGKHWVLQVARLFGEETATSNSRSRLARISLRTPKITTNNMLLVLEKAEDMETWLSTIRKQIGSLRSDTFQPEECNQRAPIAVKKQLQERSSRRILTEKRSFSSLNVSSTASSFKTARASPTAISSKKTNAAPDKQRELSASLKLENDLVSLYYQKRDNSSAVSQHTAVKEQRIMQLQKLNNQRTPPVSPPAHKTMTPGMIQAQPSVQSSPTFLHSQPPTKVIHKFDAGPLRRSTSIASDGTSKVGTPSLSNRFSQSTRSGITIPTPPQSRGSSHRSFSPVVKIRIEAAGKPRMVTLSSPLPSPQMIDAEQHLGVPASEQEWSDAEDNGAEATNKPLHRPLRLASLYMSAEEIKHSVPALSPTESLIPRRMSSLPASPASSPGLQSKFPILPGTSGLAGVPQSPGLQYGSSPNPVIPGSASIVPSSESRNGPKQVSQPPPDAFELRRRSAMAPDPAMGVCQPLLSSQASLRTPTIEQSVQARVVRHHSLYATSLPTTPPLHKRMSLSELESTPGARLMTIRKRRSLMGALPSHHYGPPTMPPPKAPLPAIPQGEST